MTINEVSAREVYNFLKDHGWRLKKILTMDKDSWRECKLGEEKSRWIMVLVKGDEYCKFELQVHSNLKCILSFKCEVWRYIQYLGFNNWNGVNRIDLPELYISDLDLSVKIDNVLSSHNLVMEFEDRVKKLLSVMYAHVCKIV